MQFEGLDNSSEYGSESDVPFPQPPLEVTVSPCSDSSSLDDSSETNSPKRSNMFPLSMQLESPNGKLLKLMNDQYHFTEIYVFIYSHIIGGELFQGSSPIPSHPVHSPSSERNSGRH